MVEENSRMEIGKNKTILEEEKNIYGQKLLRKIRKTVKKSWHN